MRTPIDLLGAQREQWDDGNNFLAVAPGVIFGYERNTTTNTFLRKQRHRDRDDRRRGARPRSRRPALHVLPHRARRRRVIPPAPGGARMALNLHGRDFLKEVDFTTAELQFLLDLSHDLKRAKATGHRAAADARAGRRADLREDVDPHAVRLRGGRLRPGRPRHLPRPGVVADRAQGVRRRHRAGAVADVRRASSSAARRRPPSRSWPPTPPCRSTTGSPTSGTPPRCSPTS